MATLNVATCTDLNNAITAPGATDCNGAAINLKTAQLATCANVDAKIDAALGAVDCNGTAIDFVAGTLATCANVDSKIDAALTAPGAVDCAGVAINLKTAQLMTCANLPAEMCEALAALPAAGVAGSTIQLIGADCKTYTIPATPVDLNVTNFAIVGGNLELTDQDGSVFQVPLADLLVFKLTDCNGVQFDYDGTSWATCQNVDEKIDAALGAVDCNGNPIDFVAGTLATCANVDSKITAALQAPGAKDCAGAAIDLTTASLATCAELAALTARVTALETLLAQLLANTDTLVDCQNNVLATFLKPL